MRIARRAAVGRLFLGDMGGDGADDRRLDGLENLVEQPVEHAVPGGLVPLTWDELRVYELRDGQMLWLEPGRGLAARPASRLR